MMVNLRYRWGRHGGIDSAPPSSRSQSFVSRCVFFRHLPLRGGGGIEGKKPARPECSSGLRAAASRVAARDGGAGGCARATSFWFTRVPRGRTHSPIISFGLDGLKRLERGDDLRLRGSAVPAEQALLPAGPDGLASLGDGDGDGIGVDAVRNHLSVRVDPEDGVLGGVVLLLAPVSVLRRGGGKGGESASRRCRAHLLRREGRRVSTRSSGIPDGGDPRERSNPGSRDGRARGCAPGRARGRPPERGIFLI